MAADPRNPVALKNLGELQTARPYGWREDRWK
jgi:hypothetical protein